MKIHGIWNPSWQLINDWWDALIRVVMSDNYTPPSSWVSHRMESTGVVCHINKESDQFSLLDL